jgi:hypothetical protein
VRIRSLTLAAVGVVFAAVDLRVVAWDAAPDVIGWLLIGLAAHRLGMRAPALLATAAAAASTAELALPYRYGAIDRITGEAVEHPAAGTEYPERLVFTPLTGGRLVAVVGAVILGGIAVTLLLRQLHRRAATTPDTQSTRRLRILTPVVPVVWTAPIVLVNLGQVIADGEVDPVWNGQWELLALPGILTAIAVALLFATTANRRWSASGDEIGSPWAELMVRDMAL